MTEDIITELFDRHQRREETYEDECIESVDRRLAIMVKELDEMSEKDKKKAIKQHEKRIQQDEDDEFEAEFYREYHYRNQIKVSARKRTRTLHGPALAKWYKTREMENPPSQ